MSMEVLWEGLVQLKLQDAFGSKWSTNKTKMTIIGNECHYLDPEYHKQGLIVIGQSTTVTGEDEYVLINTDDDKGNIITY